MKRLLLLMGFLLPLLACAQGRPLHISFFNSATAIPFTRLVTLPIHPGVEVGTEWNYKQGDRGRLFQTANASYFYHQHLAQGVALYSELGYDRRVAAGWTLGCRVGIGYLHTFATTKEYVFRDGEYQEKNDWGNARLFPSLSLVTGYDIFSSSPLHPRIFLKYQAWAEYPYSPGFIPVLTHFNLHIGTRIFLPRSSRHEHK